MGIFTMYNFRYDPVLAIGREVVQRRPCVCESYIIIEIYLGNGNR